MLTIRNILIFSLVIASVYCGKVLEIKHEEVPKHIHTVHHHHVQKYTVVKNIEVPVIKEIKVPYKVYEFMKVPYKYYVKPYIVKVPIEYYHTKEEQHEHEKHEDHHEKHRR